MGLEREGGIRGSRGSGPTALDAAVFQLTLEVKRGPFLVLLIVGSTLPVDSTQTHLNVIQTIP